MFVVLTKLDDPHSVLQNISSPNESSFYGWSGQEEERFDKLVQSLQNSLKKDLVGANIFYRETTAG